MKSFSIISKEGFTINNCDTLVKQLKILDNYGIDTIYDYIAFGCEFILNGLNSENIELIEDYYEYNNVINHYFKLVNSWDTFLFYSPSDFRGLIFDFSYLYSDRKIISYDGLHGPNNLEKVKEFTVDEFLNEYGLKKLYSTTHWVVKWAKLGINW